MSKVAFFFVMLVNLYTVTLSSQIKPPTLVIAVLIRNKAHTLPYFLTLLEKINYPKDRISLWLRSDHNIDNSIELLKLWVEDVHDQYHSIKTNFVEDKSYSDETGPTHWSSSRYDNVISLREEALNYARTIWADYLLAIDADVFLTDSNVLQELMLKDFVIVAPLLQSVGLYSNFWGAMTNEYYYERSENYEPILYRKDKGCFNVPMVHSCVLINLQKLPSDHLSYVPEKIKNYDGPRDDIIAFSLSANKSGVTLNLCNEKVYGFIMVPLDDSDHLEYDSLQLLNLKLEVLVEQEPLPVNAIFQPFITLPPKDSLGFDKIYMINLLRRSDRRLRMNFCFDELGLEVTTVDAVDGKLLSGKDIENITFLPNYADPYHKRAMTLGEVGCFLSHYNIWKEIFWSQAVTRKDEPLIAGTEMLVKVGYSYWTLGYVLSLRGAHKLLAAQPLSNLLPVDEYLPILFDKHPNDQWKKYFPNRNLIAFSSTPLLLYPTHYTGEDGYISDTEDSRVINEPSPVRSDL